MDDDALDVQAEKEKNLVLLDEKSLDPSTPFEHDHDPELRSRFQSPYLWSSATKLRVLSGPFAIAMLSSYSAGAYALASEAVQNAWGITDVQFNAGFTLYVSGFAVAPMILAPISEAYGRYWVFFGSGVVLLVSTLGCALSQDLTGLLVSRFIVGNAAAVVVTVMGGVVADVYRKEDRNRPMAMYSLSIMVGTGVGPLISGALVDSLGWRWIFFLQVILIGVAVLHVTFFYRETRTNVILRQYCGALNERKRQDERDRSVRFDVGGEPGGLKLDISILWRAYALPLKLLFTEPVVFWFSLWVAFAWGILYLTFGGIGLVFRSVYGFDSLQVGAVYTAIIVGSIIGALLISFQHLGVGAILPQRDVSRPSPEDRLLPPCVLSILLPVGLFWFGWTARASIHWISPTLAIGCLTIGVFSIYTAVFNYLADSYQAYASSAMAAQSMCRNLVSGIFPLVTGTMIRNLSIKGTGSLLGGLGLLLTVIPWLLYFWGRKIRARSSFANHVQDREDW